MRNQRSFYQLSFSIVHLWSFCPTQFKRHREMKNEKWKMVSAGYQSVFTSKVIKHRFITITLLITGDGHQKEFELTHVLVLQPINFLREKRIAGASKENREPFHAALLDRRARVSLNFG